ncbi:MAG: heavy metal translocating P-type ATPase [Caldilineaceae bacterium]
MFSTIRNKTSLPQRKPSRLLTAVQTEANAYRTEVQYLLEDIHQVAMKIDNRFQALVQTYIDPFFVSKERTQQIKDLATAGRDSISEGEKTDNRQLALGIIGLGMVAVAPLTTLPLIPAVVVIGLYLSLPLYERAWRFAVYDRKLSLAHPLSIFVTGMWLSGAYLSGLMGTILYALSRKVLAIAETRARHHMIDVFEQRVQKVWLLVDGVETEVPFEQVKVGDILVVDAGQTAPIDGTIVQGSALIDQRMLTGEAQPAEKEPGDLVLAATMVLSGKIFVSVEKTGDATSAAQIGAILNKTAAQRQSMEIKAVEIANQSLYPMLATSALGGLIFGPTTAMALLGCNFMLSMMALGPVAMLQILNRTSKQGILVKDGRALEILKEIDTIVFDKTGTLTLEQPTLVRIHCVQGPLHNGLQGDALTEDQLLALTAAAEKRQSHPLAQAIVAAARERQLALPDIEETQVAIGFGLKAKLSENAQAAQPMPSPIDASLLHIGSKRFMEMAGLVLSEELQAIQANCQQQAHTLVFVALGDQVVGALELQTSLRSEAKLLVQTLQKRKLALYIISGDHDTPTRILANELGVTGYFANTLPEQKADLVAQLQQAGHKVCFVGDGINDTIALKKADVSISLRGATTAATDTAQIVLMDTDLQHIDTLFELADEFNQRVKRLFNNSSGFSLLSAATVFFLNMGFGVVQLLNALQFARGITIAVEEERQ